MGDTPQLVSPKKSIRTCTPLAQGYPSLIARRSSRGAWNIRHPTPLGWGGVANVPQINIGYAKSIALVGHMTLRRYPLKSKKVPPTWPHNRERVRCETHGLRHM